MPAHTDLLNLNNSKLGSLGGKVQLHFYQYWQKYLYAGPYCVYWASKDHAQENAPIERAELEALFNDITELNVVLSQANFALLYAQYQAVETNTPSSNINDANGVKAIVYPRDKKYSYTQTGHMSVLDICEYLDAHIANENSGDFPARKELLAGVLVKLRHLKALIDSGVLDKPYAKHDFWPKEDPLHTDIAGAIQQQADLNGLIAVNQTNLANVNQAGQRVYDDLAKYNANFDRFITTIVSRDGQFDATLVPDVIERLNQETVTPTLQLQQPYNRLALDHNNFTFGLEHELDPIKELAKINSKLKANILAIYAHNSLGFLQACRAAQITDETNKQDYEASIKALNDLTTKIFGANLIPNIQASTLTTPNFINQFSRVYEKKLAELRSTRPQNKLLVAKISRYQKQGVICKSRLTLLGLALLKFKLAPEQRFNDKQQIIQLVKENLFGPNSSIDTQTQNTLSQEIFNRMVGYLVAAKDTQDMVETAFNQAAKDYANLTDKHDHNGVILEKIEQANSNLDTEFNFGVFWIENLDNKHMVSEDKVEEEVVIELPPISRMAQLEIEDEVVIEPSPISSMAQLEIEIAKKPQDIEEIIQRATGSRITAKKNEEAEAAGYTEWVITEKNITKNSQLLGTNKTLVIRQYEHDAYDLLKQHEYLEAFDHVADIGLYLLKKYNVNTERNNQRILTRCQKYKTKLQNQFNNYGLLRMDVLRALAKHRQNPENLTQEEANILNKLEEYAERKNISLDEAVAYEFDAYLQQAIKLYQQILPELIHNIAVYIEGLDNKQLNNKRIKPGAKDIIDAMEKASPIVTSERGQPNFLYVTSHGKFTAVESLTTVGKYTPSSLLRDASFPQGTRERPQIPNQWFRSYTQCDTQTGRVQRNSFQTHVAPTPSKLSSKLIQQANKKQKRHQDTIRRQIALEYWKQILTAFVIEQQKQNQPSEVPVAQTTQALSFQPNLTATTISIAEDTSHTIVRPRRNNDRLFTEMLQRQQSNQSEQLSNDPILDLYIDNIQLLTPGVNGLEKFIAVFRGEKNNENRQTRDIYLISRMLDNQVVELDVEGKKVKVRPHIVSLHLPVNTKHNIQHNLLVSDIINSANDRALFDLIQNVGRTTGAELAVDFQVLKNIRVLQDVLYIQDPKALQTLIAQNDTAAGLELTKATNNLAKAKHRLLLATDFDYFTHSLLEDISTRSDIRFKHVEILQHIATGLANKIPTQEKYTNIRQVSRGSNAQDLILQIKKQLVILRSEGLTEHSHLQQIVANAFKKEGKEAVYKTNFADFFAQHIDTHSKYRLLKSELEAYEAQRKPFGEVPKYVSSKHEVLVTRITQLRKEIEKLEEAKDEIYRDYINCFNALLKTKQLKSFIQKLDEQIETFLTRHADFLNKKASQPLLTRLLTMNIYLRILNLYGSGNYRKRSHSYEMQVLYAIISKLLDRHVNWNCKSNQDRSSTISLIIKTFLDFIFEQGRLPSTEDYETISKLLEHHFVQMNVDQQIPRGMEPESPGFKKSTLSKAWQEPLGRNAHALSAGSGKHAYAAAKKLVVRTKPVEHIQREIPVDLFHGNGEVEHTTGTAHLTKAQQNPWLINGVSLVYGFVTGLLVLGIGFGGMGWYVAREKDAGGTSYLFPLIVALVAVPPIAIGVCLAVFFLTKCVWPQAKEKIAGLELPGFRGAIETTPLLPQPIIEEPIQQPLELTVTTIPQDLENPQPTESTQSHSDDYPYTSIGSDDEDSDYEDESDDDEEQPLEQSTSTTKKGGGVYVSIFGGENRWNARTGLEGIRGRQHEQTAKLQDEVRGRNDSDDDNRLLM